MRKLLTKRRRRQRHSAASAAEVKARRLMPIRQRGGKWFVDVSRFTPDVPEWGEYDTRAEAEEDRDGVIRTRGARVVLEIIEQNQREQSPATLLP